MITAKQIYDATHDGLDIILHYYPQARDCVDNKKHFKRRLSEDDASACVKKFGDVYKVTDFGDTGTAMSPIDICMHEDGIRFNEAILKLAAMFNVTDELNRSVNKPEIRKQTATQDQKDGSRFFSLLSKIPDNHLAVLGPRVKQEHTEALHWYLAEYVATVRNREVTYKYSTDNYPIFMRECLVSPAEGDKPEVKFYKIYEPLNPEKQWRFSYTPEGVKPKDYINGLSELKKAFRDYNASEEAAFRKDPGNAEKPFKEKKLPEAFICSGERDALCVRSLGYHPIWFNSETYKLSESEYKEIMKYVDKLYNIPDLDATGKRKGIELALRFIDIHTVWLPEWLSSYRDRRGKPRKDFRDWIELRNTNEDFRNLLRLAMPAKFWWSKTNPKNGQIEHQIDADCLHYFLRLNGFHILKDPHAKESRYIRIQSNIVSEITAKDVKAFVRNWAEERFLNRDLRNLILNSPKLSAAALDSLKEIELDFTNHTATSQIFYMQNCCVEITGSAITPYPWASCPIESYVWDRRVIPHKFTSLDDFFTITRHPNPTGEDKYSIKINNLSSRFLCYLINTSRIHWRKELEYNFSDKSWDEAQAYFDAHHYDICGPGLSPEEQIQQMQNLVNKIFAIGYMLHRYKSPSRAWAPYAMDERVGEDGDSNGRSGKSLMFKALSNILNVCQISGRNPKLTENSHLYERVSSETDVIFVDDCDKYLNIGFFYDSITGSIVINPKNIISYTLSFEDSGKFAFTTNFVPLEFNPSTSGRLIPVVFSDYYHQMGDNTDYVENRSVADDFHMNLFSDDYTEADWNADLNFMLQCCRFYLSLGRDPVKILPPMDSIMQRKYKQDMGANFEEWAGVYFSVESGNLDRLIVREDAFNAYKMFSGQSKITMQRFTKALKGFVALCPYILMMNPEEMTNSAGRIIRKDNEGKTRDMIYLMTDKAQVERIKAQSAVKPEERIKIESGKQDIPF